MLIVGGTNSSGVSYTCVGLTACSGSARTPRCAARPSPGVSARLPPTSNLLVSTVAGSRGGVDRSRASRRAPRTRLPPPRVDRLPDHRRVRPREVRRRERVEHIPGREPCLALGTPVDVGVGDQAVDGLADREVALEQPAQQPVLLPRGVGKAPVALGGLRASERPAAARARSEVSPAARATTRRGWRTRPTPTFAPDPGARNRGAPPAAASLSITSRPERAASLVRRTRDGGLSEVVLSLIAFLRGFCLRDKDRPRWGASHRYTRPKFDPQDCVPRTTTSPGRSTTLLPNIHSERT